MQDIAPNSTALGERDRASIANLVRRSISASTEKSYSDSWKHWHEWATSRGYEPLPASGDHVAAWAAHLANSCKPATIKVRVAAIGFVHRKTGHDSPTNTEIVKSTLAGITRSSSSPQKQAVGLRRHHLPAIKAVADPETWALVLVMRDAMLRSSEACSIRYSDISESQDGSGVLTIRRSKTDQEGVGSDQYLSKSAMRAIKNIANGDMGDDGLIFPYDRWGVLRRIKRAARDAGLVDGFTGHSCRVGMAQDLNEAGFGLSGLMANGRWKSSSMVARYTRKQQVAELPVAKFYEGSE